jgi:hypothetical protein
MGPVLMLIWRFSGHEEFFRRRTERAPEGFLDDPPPVPPPHAA